MTALNYIVENTIFNLQICTDSRTGITKSGSDRRRGKESEHLHSTIYGM